ncbi:MAG: hypothetical protein A3C36_07770 [Omnitrophica WOR_2 bacterium RIFCSPHIGHO2_02_FULL_52_10]|nr:MAG: hypothetical protein A3C36_07770 [Omnitrophica WOR_2 bacterium RIFCSPHIGHO2_02_FULL_52_10]
MTDPDFIDFMMEGGHYLLFPEDFGDYQCPNCGREITEGDQVEWADQKKKIIKCPDCGQEIEVS